LNFCRNILAIRAAALLCILAAGFVALSVTDVNALDPNRRLSQFPHDRWGTENGFPGGTIYAIAQTADGYLWLGTEKGLVRFDGLTFNLLQHGNTPTLPAGPVLGLLTDADGNLWIRLQNPSVVRYRNGKFEDVLTKLGRIEPRITSMSLGSDNRILLSTFENGILRYDGEKFIALASKMDISRSIVNAVAETSAGEIWMGTRDAGLIRLSDEKFTAVTENLPDQKINCLLPIGDRELLIGTDKGVVQWDGEQLTQNGLPPLLEQVQILTMLRDRDSNIWIGTDSLGLLRFNSDGIAATEKTDNSRGGAITTLFEDREGNLWAGNDEGVERFRDSAFVTYSAAEGLPSEKNGAIYTDAENQIWFAPLDGGLERLKADRIEKITVDGLAQDIVYSMTGDGINDLWIGRQRGGLTHLTFDGSVITSKTYTQKDGLAQNSVYSVYRSRDGNIWAGTLSGGVSRLQNGELTTYTTANGLAANAVTAMAESADNSTMWFATPNGLSSLSGGVWRTLTTQDGLPSENIISLLTDSSGVLWIGTAKGLAYLDAAGRIRFSDDVPASLREPVFGLAEDKNGSLWLATSNHVLRVSRDKLLNDSVGDADVREYGTLDGLKSVEGVKRSRSVTADAAGRVWFSLGRGISTVDADRLKNSSIPALVQIQTISVDGKAIDLTDNPRFSSSLQRLVFNYAGLSLSIPERVRFRYRLEGFDKDWSEATDSREAVYTNLSPGVYSFHVIASNSDGVWNSEEAAVQFEIAPMFWQTGWFRALSVVAFALALLGLYRLRLQRITNRLNTRFEERLTERTRIAQELHDSLLQGFVSVSMQLDVAVETIPEDAASKRNFNRILELMHQVTAEGRHTLRGLRAPKDADAGNLEQAFAEIKPDINLNRQADFRVIVEGLPRSLKAIIRDEVFQIGREALINAFRHSKAKKIEIVVEYAAKYLRILVRDNGCGIESNIVDTGREGHWGLIGMRERAEKIGAQLKVWSRPSAGTEIELTVPHHFAFEKQAVSNRKQWFSKLKPLFRESNK
jgi:ligand-binding sensor domain-containing protein/signal transduction histidine kinase